MKKQRQHKYLHLVRRGITVCESGSHWRIKSLEAAVVQFQLFLFSPDSPGQSELTSLLPVVMPTLASIQKKRCILIVFISFTPSESKAFTSCLQLTEVYVAQLSQ